MTDKTQTYQSNTSALPSLKPVTPDALEQESEGRRRKSAKTADDKVEIDTRKTVNKLISYLTKNDK
jgi:hypothetical protein